MTALLELCPACGEPLTDGMAGHCLHSDRPKPCGWVVHKCKAIVDPRTGAFYAGSR